MLWAPQSSGHNILRLQKETDGSEPTFNQETHLHFVNLQQQKIAISCFTVFFRACLKLLHNAEGVVRPQGEFKSQFNVQFDNHWQLLRIKSAVKLMKNKTCYNHQLKITKQTHKQKLHFNQQSLSIFKHRWVTSRPEKKFPVTQFINIVFTWMHGTCLHILQTMRIFNR